MKARDASTVGLSDSRSKISRVVVTVALMVAVSHDSKFSAENTRARNIVEHLHQHGMDKEVLW